jgi:hypothetical protein
LAPINASTGKYTTYRGKKERSAADYLPAFFSIIYNKWRKPVTNRELVIETPARRNPPSGNTGGKRSSGVFNTAIKTEE